MAKTDPIAWRMDGETFLAADSAPEKSGGAEAFFDRFGASRSERSQYRPLFCALTHSLGGEEAVSFGLFERRWRLYEVSGSECSMRDFNGQFSPEPSSVLSLRHRATLGTLGRSDSDSSDLYASALLAALDRFGDRFPEGDPSPSEKFAMAQETIQLWHLFSFGPASLLEHPLLRADRQTREALLRVFASRELPRDSWPQRSPEAPHPFPEDCSVLHLPSRGIDLFLPVSARSVFSPLIWLEGIEESASADWPAIAARIRLALEDAQACLEAGADLLDRPAPRKSKPFA